MNNVINIIFTSFYIYIYIYLLLVLIVRVTWVTKWVTLVNTFCNFVTELIINNLTPKNNG